MSRFVLSLMVLFASAGLAQAADFKKEKKNKNGPTSVEGRVEMEEDDRNYEFTVVVKTTVKGIGETGRGHAVWIMYGEGDEVIAVLDSRKYCSTGLRKERTCRKESERQFRKKFYDSNVVSEAFVVLAEDKGDIPKTPEEVFEWCKNAVGPELRKLRDDLKPGKSVEGENYWIKKLR